MDTAREAHEIPEIRRRYCSKTFYHLSVSRADKHIQQCKDPPVALYKQYDHEGSSPGSKKRKRGRELPQEWAISAQDSNRCGELLAEEIYSNGIPSSFPENLALLPSFAVSDPVPRTHDR